MEKEFMENVNQKFVEYDKQFEEINSHLANHDKQFEKCDKQFEEIHQTLAEIKRSVLFMEDYMTNKIPALFDAYQLNQEKHEEFNSRITSTEDISYSNSLRISVLEDTSKIHSQQIKKLLS